MNKTTLLCITIILSVILWKLGDYFLEKEKQDFSRKTEYYHFFNDCIGDEIEGGE